MHTETLGEFRYAKSKSMRHQHKCDYVIENFGIETYLLKELAN